MTAIVIGTNDLAVVEVWTGDDMDEFDTHLSPVWFTVDAPADVVAAFDQACAVWQAALDTVIAAAGYDLHRHRLGPGPCSSFRPDPNVPPWVDYTASCLNCGWWHDTELDT